MTGTHDGPRTARFRPVPLAGNRHLASVPPEVAAALVHAPGGACTAWGIPFEIGDVVALDAQPVTIALPPTRAQWLVFMHTSGPPPGEPGPLGLVSRLSGQDRLGEHAAD